jgi:hypothetical protein
VGALRLVIPVSGLSHRSAVNLRKLVSVVCKTASDSRTSAASCASVTGFPAVPERLQQGEHTLDAIGARFQDLHDRLRQPGADVIGGLARRHGMFEHARARANP